MLYVQEIADKYSEDIESATQWVNEFYSNHFGIFFDEIERFNSVYVEKKKKITNDELNCILIDIPMIMIEVSNELTNTRTAVEVIKHKISQNKRAKFGELINLGLSKTDASNEVSASVEDDYLLIKLYEAVITKVESKMSFTRELIMGAKKIWDSRKNSENVNPVNPPAGANDNGGSSLPVYVK